MRTNLNQEQTEDLKAAADAAIRTEAKYGVPAALTIAQWALESGWGRYQPGNNPFGIKQYKGCYGFQTLWTHEYINQEKTKVQQNFATFPNLEAAFDYHAKLLSSDTGPYKLAFAEYREKRVPEGLAVGIAPTYAPGNPKYSSTVIQLMNNQTVTDAIAAARVRLEQEQLKPDLLEA